ncbi:hypothetical protein ACQKCU_23785 [Heyndrickxia sporothermodurans]
MVDIRDHGGIFGGNKNNELLYTKKRNASTIKTLFENVDMSRTVALPNGNTRVVKLFFSDVRNIGYEEYDKNNTLIETKKFPNLPFGSSWGSIRANIKHFSYMAYDIGNTPKTFYVCDYNGNILVQVQPPNNYIYFDYDPKSKTFIGEASHSTPTIPGIYDFNGNMLIQKTLPDTTGANFIENATVFIDTGFAVSLLQWNTNFYFVFFIKTDNGTWEAEYAGASTDRWPILHLLNLMRMIARRNY